MTFCALSSAKGMDIKMNENFKSDYYRMTGNKWNSINGMIQMLLRYDLRYCLLYTSDAADD